MLQVFAKLKDEQPKFRHQIVAIAGDCSQPNLGMSSQDRATLIREVSIVFHVAATVRFDEKLKLAVPINVRSTRDVVNLCKEITDLKVPFLHEKKNYAQKVFYILLLDEFALKLQYFQIIQTTESELLLIKFLSRVICTIARIRVRISLTWRHFNFYSVLYTCLPRMQIVRKV